MKSLPQLTTVSLSAEMEPSPQLTTGKVTGKSQRARPKRQNPWGEETYEELIDKAIRSSPERQMTATQIYDWLIANMVYFRQHDAGPRAVAWKNAIRHTLSISLKFYRLPGRAKQSLWVIKDSGGTPEADERASGASAVASGSSRVSSHSSVSSPLQMDLETATVVGTPLPATADQQHQPPTTPQTPNTVSQEAQTDFYLNDGRHHSIQVDSFGSFGPGNPLVDSTGQSTLWRSHSEPVCCTWRPNADGGVAEEGPPSANNTPTSSPLAHYGLPEPNFPTFEEVVAYLRANQLAM